MPFKKKPKKPTKQYEPLPDRPHNVSSDGSFITIGGQQFKRTVLKPPSLLHKEAESVEDIEDQTSADDGSDV